MLGQKEKSHTRKNSNTTLGNKPESTGERRKIKKQYRQNRTFQNNERKFYQQVERDDTNTYNLMQEKLNNSGVRYSNQENITKKPNG